MIKALATRRVHKPIKHRIKALQEFARRHAIQIVGNLTALTVGLSLLLVSANGVVIAMATYMSGRAAGKTALYFMRKRRAVALQLPGKIP
jgi:hypothetical protein